MKFAHLSDIHIGGWREPKMRELNLHAFLSAMNRCVAERVDFILIAGDLFNTALPEIDKLNVVTRTFHELKNEGIRIYVIAGSHDFSASGKTMLDVLESAGLIVNVCKGEVVDQKLRLRFTLDAKTGAKITGMVGKKGMLDRIFYDNLDCESLEREEGYKIFMFHIALTELKPMHLEKMDAYPVSLLPRGFAYYAGGHVHHRHEFSGEGYKMVTQPGALFPNNFGELEKYGYGGFYIADGDRVEWVPVKVKDVVSVIVGCNGKSPENVTAMIVGNLKDRIVKDVIVTIRCSGVIQGKVSDVSFNAIVQDLYGRGAYMVMKNTAGLMSEEFDEVKVEQSSVEEMEDKIIREHAGQITIGVDEIRLTKELMTVLSVEKAEGETVRDFEERVKKEALRVIGL